MASRSFASSSSSAWSHRLRSTRPYLVRGLQIACLLHVITTHLFEVRGCEGPSMLPTLSPQGDWLLQVRLPFARWLEGLRASERTGAGAGMPWKTRISKKDPTCGLPLRIGDMVVSASPRNPSRYVCKRIVGLPGDRVLMDPRVQLGEVAEASQPEAEAEAQAEAEAVVGQSSEEGETAGGGGGEEAASPSPSSLLICPVQRKGPDLYVTVPVGHVFLTGDNLSHSTDSRHYGPVPLGCIKGKVVARVWPSPRWFTGETLTLLAQSDGKSGNPAQT